MKNRGYKIILRSLCMLLMVLCIGWGKAATAKADGDGDQLWANFSNIRTTSANGCNAQAVYQYCTFYANFWNPNKNLHMRSASVTIKKNGTTVASDTVWSSDSNHYFNYASIPFLIKEAGTYTAERSGTTLSGSTLTFETYTLVVNNVADCGTVLTVSPSSLSLSMTGTSSYDITAKVSGIMPDSRSVSYSYSSSDITCSWNGWYDSDGDGENDSDKLTVKGKTGGSDTITIYFKESNTNTVISKKTVSVTIGPNYTVSYNANGGSGAPSSQTKYYGKTLTLSSTKPTRTGYTFLGWSTSSTATSATYSARGIYTLNSGATLYAVWKPYEYTVSYNANGGSGAPSSQIKYYGKTLPLSSTKPTRTGHTFLGWSTSSTATSATYSAGGSYTSNSSVTLYAVWKPYEYTVSYNANGGSGAPSSQTKYYGQTLTLRSTKPTRTGYTFLGWSTSSIATSPTYSAGGSYTSNSSVTLYAVWKPYEYTVSYNANGGSGAPSSQIKYYGKTLPLSSTKPTRTGHTFLGWSTSSTATSPTYSAGENYTSNNSVTLYAVWELEKYTIKFDANGGSGAPSPQIKYYGTILYFDTSMEPTRTGCTFLGWSTSRTATSPTYRNCYTANASATLYAVWKLNEYTVKYDANGGNGAPSSQIKYYGKTLPLSSTKPTRTGHTFLGWSTSSTATSPTYSAGGSYTSNSSVTLYAVWKLNEYTVKYDANGGIGTPSSQTKYYGKSLPLSNEKPTRTGYTFMGWSESSKADTVDYSAGDNYTSNKGVTLYAVWKLNRYIVKYDANGGSGAPSSQTKYYGKTLILSSDEPVRAGYSFLGWSTSSTADAVDYSVGDSYTANKGVTLYAVWKKKSIAVRSVALNKSSLTLLMGKSAVLTATVSPGNASVKTIKWSSGNSKVAAVGSDGTVKGISKGTTTIIAKSSNGKTASCKVIVKVPLSKLKISVKNATYTGKQIKPAVTVKYGSSVLKYGTDYTLSYGKNVAAGTGTVNVIGKGYYTGTVQKTFTIAKSPQSITAASITKTYGSRDFSLNAKAAGNGKLTYTVSDSKVAVVSAGGTASIKGYGKTNVTISAAETSNYKAARKTITITVKPRKVSWDSVYSPEKGKIWAIWKADEKASGYIVSVSPDASFSSGMTKMYAYSKDVVKKKFSGIIFESGKVYYFRVQAYKTCGNERIPGAWSETKSVKVK